MADPQRHADLQALVLLVTVQLPRASVLIYTSFMLVRLCFDDWVDSDCVVNAATSLLCLVPFLRY